VNGLVIKHKKGIVMSKIKIVLDETAKEQLNVSISGIKFICELYDYCAEGECPFRVIDKDTKIPHCMFSSLPNKWDTIK